jgi:hypothetical protein
MCRDASRRLWPRLSRFESEPLLKQFASQGRVGGTATLLRVLLAPVEPVGCKNSIRLQIGALADQNRVLAPHRRAMAVDPADLELLMREGLIVRRI